MRTIASSIAVALLMSLLSTPAFACKRTFADWLIPPPDTVPADIEFTFRNEIGNPIQATLEDAAGNPVPLDPPVQFDGDFSTIRPSQPLTDGDYTLYVGDRAASDETQQSFTVRSGATHADVSGTLSLEAGQPSEVTSCGESPWFALVTLRNAEGIAPVAFFLNEVVFEDGSTRTVAAGQYLFPNEQWDPNTSEIVYSTGTSRRPECVDVTAVLTTGKKVPLGSACDSSTSAGGGCSSTGSDFPSPLPLSVLLAFVGLGLVRREPRTRHRARGKQKLCSQIAAVLLVVLASPAVWACSTTFGVLQIPVPDVVPPDVVFTVWDTVDGPDVTLTNEAGEDVPLESPVHYPWEYSTIAPQAPLPDGTYTWTVAPKVETNEQQQTFVVDSGASHEAFEPSIRMTGRPGGDSSCDSEWAADIELRDPEGMPPAAFYLHEFVLESGEVVSTSGGPGWWWVDEEPAPSTSIRYSVNLQEPPKCVEITAVLTTGKQVPLGETCDPDAGGGCATASGAPLAPSALLVLVGLFLRRAGRKACELGLED